MNAIVYYVDSGDNDTEFFYSNERDAIADAKEMSRSKGIHRVPRQEHVPVTVSRIVVHSADRPQLMLALLNRAGFYKETKIIGAYVNGNDVGVTPPQELQPAGAIRSAAEQGPQP